MDPACFGSQRAVDTTIDDISHTIGVSRAALNVVCIMVCRAMDMLSKPGSGCKRTYCRMLHSDNQVW